MEQLLGAGTLSLPSNAAPLWLIPIDHAVKVVVAARGCINLLAALTPSPTAVEFPELYEAGKGIRADEETRDMSSQLLHLQRQSHYLSVTNSNHQRQGTALDLVAEYNKLGCYYCLTARLKL